MDDQHIHAELNHHARMMKIKLCLSAIQSLRRACEITYAADDAQLSAELKREKASALASIDRTLDEMCLILSRVGEQ